MTPTDLDRIPPLLVGAARRMHVRSHHARDHILHGIRHALGHRIYLV